MTRMSRKAQVGFLVAATIQPTLAAQQRYSPWDFMANPDPGGSPVCVAFAGAAEDNPLSHFAMIRAQKSSKQFVFAPSKDSWEVSEGTNVDVVINFQDNRPIRTEEKVRGNKLSINVQEQM